MRSLRLTIITPFLLGSLALTVFLSYYTHSSTRSAVSQSVQLISRAQTRNVYNTISLLFGSMGSTVERMTTDPHVTQILEAAPENRTALADDTGGWFEMLIQGNEYYRGIMVVDAEGVCVAANSPMQMGVSYARRPHVILALEGEFAFGETHVGKKTKNLTATAAAPVYIDGEVKGAVIMVNDFANIFAYDMEGESGIQSIFTALLAPGGHFVSHFDPALMAEDRAYPDLYSRFAGYLNGEQVVYELEGERYVGYAMLEPTTGWVVISSGVESKVFRPATKLSIVVFVGSLAALCLISFLVIRVVNGVLSSLLSLIDYAKKVSEGDLGRKLENTGRTDELGVLHGSLQAMVTAMRKMVTQSQQASRMKSEFLANTSHEIRTPLNAVIGMAHLYLENEDDGEAKKRDYVTKIQVAAKSLLGIINNILDISKIEAGMFELDHTAFNLRDTLEQILVIHQEGASAKGLAFSIHYAEDLPEYFRGDPVRVGQVLNNLTSNAIKFTEKGSVTISCKRDTAPGSGKKTRIRVDVADTGLGIEQSKLDKLFRPFSQADTSITRRFGGTGLGLAISDTIVAMLGGTFSVTSAPGKGTVFGFTMQLEDAEDSALEQVGPDADLGLRQLDLSGKRILIAEDNDINRLVIEELLIPTGATITMAENGRIAVDAARAEAFDLVLMDVQMPVLDGIQATREIREFACRETLPIIAVTANAMKEDKDRGFAIGLNDYITKPIEPKELAMALRRWLAG